MSASTTFLNLYKPGGGSTGLIVPDEVVDIDRINTNMDTIDTFASGMDTFRTAQNGRNQQYRGLTADIGAVTSTLEGDTYQETDGDKNIHRYNGTTWKLWHGQKKPFTPSWTNFTPGTSTVSAFYWVEAGRVYAEVDVLLAAGFTMSASTPRVALPVAPEVALPDMRPLGQAFYLDSGSGRYFGELAALSGEAELLARGASAFVAAVTNAVPFGWAVTDQMHLTLNYPLYN